MMIILSLVRILLLTRFFSTTSKKTDESAAIVLHACDTLFRSLRKFPILSLCQGTTLDKMTFDAACNLQHWLLSGMHAVASFVHSCIRASNESFIATVIHFLLFQCCFRRTTNTSPNLCVRKRCRLWLKSALALVHSSWFSNFAPIYCYLFLQLLLPWVSQSPSILPLLPRPRQSSMFPHVFHCLMCQEEFVRSTITILTPCQNKPLWEWGMMDEVLIRMKKQNFTWITFCVLSIISAPVS